MITKPSKGLFIYLLILVVVSSSAQHQRFRKITKEEWSIDKCLFDSTAKGLILFDVGEIKYEFHPLLTDEEIRTGHQTFDISYTHHRRMKFLSPQDSPVTTITIPLYLYPEMEKSLNSFRAILFSEKKRTGKKQKFKRRDLVKKEGKYGKYYALILEDIPSGSILDIEFFMNSDYLYHIPAWSFSNKYPILYSKVSYTIPQFMDVTASIGILDQLTESSATHTSETSMYFSNFETAQYYPFNFIYRCYELDSIKSMKQPRESHIFRHHVNSLNISGISNQPEPIRIYYYSQPAPTYNK